MGGCQVPGTNEAAFRDANAARYMFGLGSSGRSMEVKRLSSDNQPNCLVP